jgi:hypothetical protein
MTTDPELKDFLARVDRLVEPALLYGKPVHFDRVLETVEKAFEGRFVFKLRANGPLPPNDADVAEIVQNSFEGRGVLAVLVNDKAPTGVVGAVSRLCNDGVFARKKDGIWEHTRPPEEWRMILIAEVDSPEALPGGLGDCFPAVLAL